MKSKPSIKKKKREKPIVKPNTLTTNSQSISSFLEAFDLFISSDIKQIIIEYSNQRGKHLLKDNWIDINLCELNAFIGIHIVMGAVHDNKNRVSDLWSRDDFHIPFYASVMTRNRFLQILRCIRFDDMMTRQERAKNDRLAAFREVSDLFQQNCVKNFNTGFEVTTDERIISFNGRCKFKVYMPNKPDSYGIKCWMMVDSQNHYVKKFRCLFRQSQ